MTDKLLIDRELLEFMRSCTLAWAAEYEYRHGMKGFDQLHKDALAKADAILAQPAAPTDTEAVEVVAILQTEKDQFGEYDYYDTLHGVPAGTELMTVAQHQRLMAAEIQKRFDGNEVSSREHREELAAKDARIAELRDEITQLNTALTIKNGTIAQLKARNAQLEDRNAALAVQVEARQVPEGWRVERRELDGSVCFIIGSPRIVGVRSNTSVWESDSDPAHLLLWHMLAAWQRTQSAGVPEGLNKTREQWQKVDAKQCANSNSSAANFYLIRDAQQDIERLHRALAAALAAQQSAPDRVSVPVEPTHQMVLAGETQWENSGHEAPCATSMYRAMLAAAPARPSVQDDDWLTLAHEMEALGNRYWKAAVRERGPGAVQWLRNEETGCMFVFTRGEYADQLQEFCASLPLAQVKRAQPAAPHAQPEVQRLREALAGLLAIVDDSRGVAGYHLNGAIADWDEFPEVESARAMLAAAPKESTHD